MSINLTLHDLDHDSEIELWQTPTYITRMCLSWSDELQDFDGGQEGVRKRYLFWVDFHLNGVWKSEEFKDMRSLVAEHKAKVLAVKNPKFGWI